MIKVQGARIRTPATTANFGPGFDCVGLALDLYNEVEAFWEEPVTGKFASQRAFEAELKTQTELEVYGEGASLLVASGAELFFKALAYLLAQRQVLPRRLKVVMKNKIPLSRGLGSSAAGIVAALYLAKEILTSAGFPLEKETLAKAAVHLEGHPDNVLPALYGGAGLSWPGTDGELDWVPFSVPSELHFVLAVPEIQVSTSEARRVLPKRVPLKIAVENSALLAGLILSLGEKNYSKLRSLIQGPLHVPYRSGMIPGYRQVEEAAYNSGALAFTISGSGPTVLALTLQDPEQVGKAMVEAFRKHGQIDAWFFISKVEQFGTTVKRIDRP
ncbi:MAG: homoserine kinase [Firmicutes bacterium]|nr:homoserine kinase [Bacillota bacterium]